MIDSIILVGVGLPVKVRLVQVRFNDGETVEIAGAYGGYEQYGSFGNHYVQSQPVASRYTRWLNGGAKPVPLVRYPTSEASPAAPAESAG